VGLLMDLSELAASLKLARLSWNGEMIAMETTPACASARFTLALPPGILLQPTKEGERILQTLVSEAAAGSPRSPICSPAAARSRWPLADGRRVHAVDSAEPQIEALLAAGRAGQGQAHSGDARFVPPAAAAGRTRALRLCR
jgi:23S rRNA (uracil1939-C5)-methyltransferase